MSDSQTTAELGRADIRVASEPKINPEVIREIALGTVGETKKLSSSVRRAIEALGNKEAERALQMIAGEVMPFGEKDVEGVLLENLSSQDRDPNTGQKKEPNANTPERQRYDETKKTAEALRQYLENPQNEPSKDLLEIVKSYLFTSPALRELIIDQQGQFTSNADEIAKTLLRQPKAREMIRRFYVERLDPSKRLEHDKVVAQLKGELAELMAQVVDAKQIEQDISSKKQELATQQQKILSDPNYIRYRDLQTELDILEENLRAYNDYLQRSKQQINLQNIFNSYFGSFNLSDVGAVKRRIAEISIQLQTDASFANINNASLRIQQLTSELSGLETKKQSINPEQQKKLQAQIAEKQAQMQEAESLLLAERIKYAGKIQSIVPEALKSYLDEAFQTARDSYIEQTKKFNNEALNQAIDKITARLGRQKAKKGKIETYVADKKKAGELLQKLLTPDGVERLFDATDGELKLNQQHLVDNYGLSEEEARIFIKEVTNDPEYKHQVASKMAAAVFSDYILKGGRLSQDLVLAMTSTEWGKQLINEGQALVQERREKLENLFGKGVINRFDELKGKSGEWIKQNWRKVGLGILIILLLLGGKAALDTLFS